MSYASSVTNGPHVCGAGRAGTPAPLGPRILRLQRRRAGCRAALAPGGRGLDSRSRPGRALRRIRAAAPSQWTSGPAAKGAADLLILIC